ncbi:MAG: HAD-IIA family hydrolase [Planctomycetia bacterium]|nr:HAD-IIA family hydrolase [Planctomycetia bacterium]
MNNQKNASIIYFDDKVDLSKIKHVVFDMDGTIYKGKILFPYTKSTFDALESMGIGYTYLTNNSSTSAKDYLQKITKLGLKGKDDNIFTSSLATLYYLRQHYPDVKSIYVLGTESLRQEFTEFGYKMITEYDEEEPEMIIVAFDTTLTYDRLCKGTYWVQQGKPFIATHPDTVCPTDKQTVLVDCGAVCALIKDVTEREPEAIPGKPSPEMLQGIMARYNLQKDEIAMVGDRLYTDLEMARRAGIVGVLVLTGEATLETLAESGMQPELVLDNISTLAQLLKESRQ